MLLPTVSPDSSLTWHIVFVNSNGEERTRFQIDFVKKECRKYIEWVDNQSFNRIYFQKSMCWENIQQDFGTCGNWSLILIFQFFVDFSRFHNSHDSSRSRDFSQFDDSSRSRGSGRSRRSRRSRGSGRSHVRAALDNDNDNGGNSTAADTTDQIAKFCKELSKRTRSYVTINRFNNYIADLETSFRHLFISTMRKLRIERGVNPDPAPDPASDKSPIFDSTSDESPTPADFAAELLYGPVHRSVLLDCAIFRHVERLQNHLRKYIDKWKQRLTRQTAPETDVDSDVDSDVETEEEARQRSEFRDQKQRFEEKQLAEEKKFKLKAANASEVRKLNQHLFASVNLEDSQIDEEGKAEFLENVDKLVSLLDPSNITDQQLPTHAAVKTFALENIDSFLQNCAFRIAISKSYMESNEKNIAKFSKILEENPDAPRFSEYPAGKHLTLADDIIAMKQDLQKQRSELNETLETQKYYKKMREDVENQSSGNYVDRFFERIDKFKRSFNKHKRDE